MMANSINLGNLRVRGFMYDQREGRKDKTDTVACLGVSKHHYIPEICSLGVS